jgi:hypothetical protein
MADRFFDTRDLLQKHMNFLANDSLENKNFRAAFL